MSGSTSGKPGRRLFFRRDAHALWAFIAALLFAPALLLYLAWQQAARSGELMLHVQGLPLPALILIGLCVCAAGTVLPFSRMPRWLVAGCGALLAPALGGLACML